MAALALRWVRWNFWKAHGTMGPPRQSDEGQAEAMAHLLSKFHVAKLSSDLKLRPCHRRPYASKRRAAAGIVINFRLFPSTEL